MAKNKNNMVFVLNETNPNPLGGHQSEIYCEVAFEDCKKSVPEKAGSLWIEIDFHQTRLTSGAAAAGFYTLDPLGSHFALEGLAGILT